MILTLMIGKMSISFLIMNIKEDGNDNFDF